jgi:hypothetical protein
MMENIAVADCLSSVSARELPPVAGRRVRLQGKIDFPFPGPFLVFS